MKRLVFIAIVGISCIVTASFQNASVAYAGLLGDIVNTVGDILGGGDDDNDDGGVEDRSPASENPCNTKKYHKKCCNQDGEQVMPGTVWCRGPSNDKKYYKCEDGSWEHYAHKDKECK